VRLSARSDAACRWRAPGQGPLQTNQFNAPHNIDLINGFNESLGDVILGHVTSA
jgi:hypothetical protein